MKRKMLSILLFLITSLSTFIFVVFTRIGFQLYFFYEGLFLYTHYEGETKVVYYANFLVMVVIPACITLGALVTWFYYGKKN